MRLDDVRGVPIFEGVTDEQLQYLLDNSDEVPFQPGDRVWQQGEPAVSWWVLVDGRVDLVRTSEGDDVVMGSLDAPGRWAGGFHAWDSHGVYLATGRAAQAGRLLRVPAPVLRALLSSFPLSLHFIDGLYRTARNIDANTRQRESLVALGTLAAGLAHELNNPAAAATRAVDALEGSMAEVLSALGGLAGGSISAEEFVALEALRREALAVAEPVDALAVADREDELADWMSAAGVEDGWRLTPALAAAGLGIEWCERVAATVPHQAVGPALAWVSTTLQSAALLGEVKESTRRVSELVAAVRSYSQLDRAARQPTDLREGLDSTLVMLRSRIPEGVAVVTDYAADVPRIDAVAGELNQVWTNLVVNALDAMAGSGTLRLSTRLDGDQVEVTVADTGPGMTADVQEHAFDAFFTTKDVGQGTGLGLDISRRIVERHHGRILIESQPGRTVLRVLLPVAATD